MARKIQSNSFEKGMNKALSPDRMPGTMYRDLRNFRLNDDKEKSIGSLVNVLGNTLDFTIPDSPSVFIVVPIPGIDPPLSGAVDGFTVETYAGTVSFSVSMFTGGFEDYFNQIYDISITPGSGLNSLGIKVIRTGPHSIALYSFSTEIISVNPGTTSAFTDGSQIASKQTNLEVIGRTELRDTLVLFTTNVADTIGGPGQIWIASYNKELDDYTVSLRYTHDDLLFSKYYPIEAIARYENQTTQRTYFTDNHSNVRTLNIATEESGMGVDVAFLDLTPTVNFSKPVVDLVSSGGSLKAGIYQYAYRLSSTTGAQTKFSPASKMVNVCLGNESGTEWDFLGEYNGTDPGTVTTKSVAITIKDIDTSYSTIELAYLYYGDSVATPEIFIFESIEIPTSGELSSTHTGAELSFTITDSEYQSFGLPFNRAKTISFQDNRLFVANVATPVNEKLIFHSRAYRFGNQSTAYDSSGTINPFNSANSFPVAGLANPNIRAYVPGLNVADIHWGYQDPEDPSIGSIVRNAINPYNKPDWASDFLQFKWQKDGVTLGGEGPFVKYNFITSAEVEGGDLIGYDTDTFDNKAPVLTSGVHTSVYDFNTNNEEYKNTNTFKNNKSPYISHFLKGYPPGEIYRMGIVLYDLSGNPGFVNWIGDIKFPERWEMRANMLLHGIPANGEYATTHTPSSDFAYGSGDDLTLFHGTDIDMGQMGIQFTITLPAEIRGEVSGYEIVRVKRELSDRTKLTQGIANILVETKNEGNLHLLPGKLDSTLHQFTVKGVPSNGFNFTYPVNESSTLYPAAAKKSLVLYTPELQFFNNIGFSVNDRIRVEAGFTHITKIDNTTNLAVTIADGVDHTLNVIESTSNTNGDPMDSFRIRANGKRTIPIEYAIEVGAGAQSSSIPTITPGVKFINSTPPGGDLPNLSGEPEVDGASCLFITLPEDLRLPGYYSGDFGDSEERGIDDRFLLVTYERALTDQYGGNTQAARANRLYIRTGGFIRFEKTAPINTFKVFGGDVFHVQYDMTRTDGALSSDPGNTSARDGYVFPTLSTINTSLRRGYHLLNKAAVDTTYPLATDTNFKHDSFVLSSLYSREDDYISFNGRPIIPQLLEEFDNRVYASNAKINGELIDNWRQFPVLLYKDVEGSLGPINKLILYKDAIFFFQNHGCGYLMINPRASASTVEGGSLEMGFGDVLHDFEYISTEVGCFHQWVPVATNTNLFFIDAYKKQMYSIQGKSLTPVSLIGGMNPWFYDRLVGGILVSDNPLLERGINTIWEDRFNEVWFTFHNTTQKGIIGSTFKPALHSFNGAPLTYAAYILTSNINLSLAVVGSFISFTYEDGSAQELEILGIETVGNYTYLQLSSLPGIYSTYNDVLDSFGNVDDNILKQMNRYLKESPGIEGKSISREKETLVYNETYNMYVGFLDHFPTIYLNDGSHILSPNPLSGSDIYRHNSGQYGMFYGTVFDGRIELIANGDNGITKVFENFSYFNEAFTNTPANPIGIDAYTFASVRCRTAYQNTDWVIIDVTNKESIRKVEREWQLAIARNAVLQSATDVDILDPANLDVTQKFKERLRDKLLIVELVLDNTADRRFLLHYFKTYYNISNR